MAKPYEPSRVEHSPDGYCFVRMANGLIAIFDECDSGVMSRFHWYPHKRGRGIYAMAHDPSDHKKCVHMHRLVVSDAPKDVDHINGDGLDNRRCNLRPATRSQNIANTPPRSDNKLGVRGVCLHKATGKYLTQIMVNQNRIYLGIYNTVDEAATVYREASIKHFGEFTNKCVLCAPED